jgi:excisionase family DNA binding protein
VRGVPQQVTHPPYSGANIRARRADTAQAPEAAYCGGRRLGVEQLLNVREVARVLNVPARTVYYWAEHRDPRKHLPSIKLGRCLRFRPEVVEAYVAERERPS